MRQLLTRAKWISAGFLVGLAVVTLWAQEPQQFNRGINVIRGNLTTSAGYVYSGASPVRSFRTNTIATDPSTASFPARRKHTPPRRSCRGISRGLRTRARPRPT